MADIQHTVLPNEQWRPVPGYEGYYEVSDQGRVRSLDRLIVYVNGDRHYTKGKLKSVSDNGNGYLSVSLSRNNSDVRRYVHRLVLEAFVGPAPEGMEACHGNAKRHDNRLSNLRWDTRVENCKDTKLAGNSRASWTHCKRGHEFTPENTLRQNEGHRACRECHKEIKRRYRKRLREKKLKSQQN